MDSKTVTVAGKPATLYSLDGGRSWFSNRQDAIQWEKGRLKPSEEFRKSRQGRWGTGVLPPKQGQE